MDDNLLDALDNTWATAATAPGMGIPGWLYRRCLYLLDAQSMPDAIDTRDRIQNDLLTQTGIRVPCQLMRAIALTYVDINPYRRHQIYNFTEAQMRPAEGDGQIQPVGPIRRKADNVAQEERSRMEAAHNLLSISGQVPQAASLTVDLEFTEETGTTNQGNHFQNDSSVGASLPADDHVLAPVTDGHDANASRNQTHPQQGLLLSLEQHTSPSTEIERSGAQARLRAILRDINAAEIIGMPLDGEHVQPTDQYLSPLGQHLPPATPPRGDGDVLTPASRTRAGPRTGKGGSKTASPATTAKVDTSGGRPTERTQRARPTRAQQKPAVSVLSERVTRSSTAERKREELDDAKKTQADGEYSSSTSKDEYQATRRPRLILSINITTGKISKSCGEDAQINDKATGEDQNRGEDKGRTSSPAQLQGPEDRPTPLTPRRLILHAPTIVNPRRLILNPPKAPMETKPTGKSRKRPRSQEQQDRGDAAKDSDNGKGNVPAKKQRTGK
ncbi:hypothetical protein G647_03645 [Cladophialophora carrionii CBS 160.54]|uniref:Uncharacterized protein n=1 Tax=Cladophialophora carrionii CBS 160.54 TaxID=1279043 RepID=V9DC42_9EURO|nr:uncharacterized protein G647_03645 [Cladophialophora carrionii CBS 160.54]ETI24276.1 hypothetical protein G647_03645 [Cladophialophora carrionii CBS 160.54]